MLQISVEKLLKKFELYSALTLIALALATLITTRLSETCELKTNKIFIKIPPSIA